MTNPTTPPMVVLPEDALKFAYAILHHRIEWTTNAISGSDCGLSHELEIDAINDIVRQVGQMAAVFGYPDKYSDGREVISSTKIYRGLMAWHIWQPYVNEPSQSWRGNLPGNGPDEPSPGVYEVETVPATQELRVSIVMLETTE